VGLSSVLEKNYINKINSGMEIHGGYGKFNQMFCTFCFCVFLGH
jgi:hypothetical protein